jgi:hypothetical protein
VLVLFLLVLVVVGSVSLVASGAIVLGLVRQSLGQ